MPQFGKLTTNARRRDAGLFQRPLLCFGDQLLSIVNLLGLAGRNEALPAHLATKDCPMKLLIALRPF
jgi:hypothetical protein